MSMLTKLYGRPSIESSQAAASQPTVIESAEAHGDSVAVSEKHSDQNTYGDAGLAHDHEGQTEPFQEVDVSAYFRALDQIKSAFGDMHERLRLSHEEKVSLSADALQQMSALHRIEDEALAAKREAQDATAHVLELTERLTQEIHRSEALESQVKNLERDLQNVILRNSDLEALLRRMHQGLSDAFAQDQRSG